MSSKKPATKAGTKGPAPTSKAPAKKAGGPAKGAGSKGGAGAAPAKGAAAAAAAPPKPKPLPIETVSLKEINVWLNDSKGLVKESGRWPLVIDESERVMVFLRHRDCNNLNILDPKEMEPDSIRMALLGAIRHGKPMTINLGNKEEIEFLQDRFNEAMPDLWNLLLTKKILEDDMYMKLVKPTDDKDYTQNTVFAVQEGFTFAFITSNPNLSEDTMGKVIVFKVE